MKRSERVKCRECQWISNIYASSLSQFKMKISEITLKKMQSPNAI